MNAKVYYKFDEFLNKSILQSLTLFVLGLLS